METTVKQADDCVIRLMAHKQAWLTTLPETRLHYLDRCSNHLWAVATPWVQAACLAKGLNPEDQIAGEEWLTGPFVIMRYLRLMRQTLQAMGNPPLRVKGRSPDQQITQVFPNGLFDRLLYRGITAEVWSQPGHSFRQEQDGSHLGEVALILGAGNISSIAPLDVLHQLFVENRVALLKMNPVNASIGPWIEQVFADLQADGFFEMVYGDATLGAYLCQHSEIDAVHITGAQQTHDAIVWGQTFAEQQQRKSAQTPKLTQSITSELGGVTPIVVVPGEWSAQALMFQARHVASMVVHNAGFNCVAGKVLVLAKDWPQRDLFLAHLRQQLQHIPPRRAYYPGAQERYRRFLDHYPGSEILGASAAGCIPWTFMPDIAPAAGEYALTEEAFCGVLAAVSLESSDAADFLEAAVNFVNHAVYGTLSCTVLIDPQTRRQHQSGFENAIAQLRYGSIGINIWSGALFTMPEIPWGSFPGNPLKEIGSGQGFVHNTCGLRHPQKAVVSAPFQIWPTPAWFAQHQTLKHLGQTLIAFEHNPSWRTILPVIATALAG